MPGCGTEGCTCADCGCAQGACNCGKCQSQPTYPCLHIFPNPPNSNPPPETPDTLAT
ncbi:hypothetical protein BU26DRAFT_519259 [Trematosphaeria pertusa]|uniref:Metallothionein n=1 Tax=Trematosphaeria pertusa TaxID=390896 RepID=A0A6A6IHS9_9PLEO|nr:uncharacterized protein BU26DRAFT_519259 [Trematosphaeria pertusa]KAF2249103.1 hypothetical protein BU26DRAFT_519259 [Trematosphaeria pertusa]